MPPSLNGNDVQNKNYHETTQLTNSIFEPDFDNRLYRTCIFTCGTSILETLCDNRLFFSSSVRATSKEGSLDLKNKDYQLNVIHNWIKVQSYTVF